MWCRCCPTPGGAEAEVTNVAQRQLVDISLDFSHSWWLVLLFPSLCYINLAFSYVEVKNLGAMQCENSPAVDAFVVRA